MKKIVFDIYGADQGPAPLLDGAMEALQTNPDFGMVLVGDEALIRPKVEQYAIDPTRIEILHTTDYISNDEPAAVVFAGREQSSMVMAYRKLKEDADCIGMISAGATGALLVGSIRHLGLIEGLKTPALSSYLPLYTGELTCLVDCGANIQPTAKDLLRFALMGDAFRRCMAPGKSAKVALLSVGKEDSKGTPLTLEAFSLLREAPIDFIGNMEGSDLVTGYADVIVADGFAGNILLKSTEAAGLVARGILDHIAAQSGKSGDETVQAVRHALTQTFHFNARGGATFLGTQKTVIKMHGCAVKETVGACIDQLLSLEKAGFAQKIRDALK